MTTLDRLRAELAEVEKRAPIFRVGRIQGADLRLVLAVVEASRALIDEAPREDWDGGRLGYLGAELYDALAAVQESA